MLSPVLLLVSAALLRQAGCWDVAVTTSDQKIQYYNKNATLVNTEECAFEDLSALAYDTIFNLLLFVDDKNANDTIFGRLNNISHPLVRRQNGTKVKGIAFDPFTRTLFWTDILSKSIYRMSVADSKSNGYGELIIQLDKGAPTSIAVDSCRSSIYWTNSDLESSTIERANLDGTDRKVIISGALDAPVSVVVDVKSQRLYWADDSEGIHFKIESSDLNGNDRRTIVKDTNQQPKDITVGEDAVYWSDELKKYIWTARKDASEAKPTKFVDYSPGDVAPKGIAVKNDMAKQVDRIPECSNLKEMVSIRNRQPNLYASTLSRLVASRTSLCVRGSFDSAKGACDCSPGYSGYRCEKSKCDKYCSSGMCILENGQPKCRCRPGERCSVDVCDGYCLNGGFCSQNFGSAMCTCPANFGGTRCEQATDVPVHNADGQHCNCTATNMLADSALAKAVLGAENASLGTTDGLFVEAPPPCGAAWDWRDPVILGLGALSGLLSIACAVLVTKMLQLKKRPRIRKRIIVNKNVTPLAQRPEQQCEITIENCCNMNICETPCFEPRSTIRPSLLGTKAGKEEKKNLISNMEHPDDGY